MMKQFMQLSKLKPGDQVGIISPSAGLPGLFPAVQDLGLQRLRDIFQLQPIEYPTTREMGSTLEDRARDIMAAFADKNNKAVFSSIGGEDQIKLIKYLDPQIFLDNPKPFFGYSDNTHLHNFVWDLGIPSYYGGSVMVQLGMHGHMDEMTVTSLRRALFEQDTFEIFAADEYTDIGLNWAEEGLLTTRRSYEPNDGFIWDGIGIAQGILWGGCVESLVFQMTTGKYLPSVEDLQGTVLYLETAEDIPEAWLVECVLGGMGERGWLDVFEAVIVGRPKAWEFDKPNSKTQKVAYTKEQQETVVRAVREYNKAIPIVQNMDFGHTDPQTILPSGNTIKIDAGQQRMWLSY